MFEYRNDYKSWFGLEMMGMEGRVDVFAADFITGFTYVGVNSGDSGECLLSPYILMPTSELVGSDYNDYKKIAVRRFENALLDETTLTNECPLCSEGRITFCKLETITIPD